MPLEQGILEISAPLATKGPYFGNAPALRVLCKVKHRSKIIFPIKFCCDTWWVSWEEKRKKTKRGEAFQNLKHLTL